MPPILRGGGRTPSFAHRQIVLRSTSNFLAAAVGRQKRRDASRWRRSRGISGPLYLYVDAVADDAGAGPGTGNRALEYPSYRTMNYAVLSRTCQIICNVMQKGLGAGSLLLKMSTLYEFPS